MKRHFTRFLKSWVLSFVCLRPWLLSTSNEITFSDHSFIAQPSVLFQAMGLAFCLSFSELYATLPIFPELKLDHQPTHHGALRFAVSMVAPAVATHFHHS